MKRRLKPVLSGRFFAKLTSSARKVLCSLIVTALLAQPSQAARNVQVQVDGELLDTRAYVEEGVTYVPLRHLLDSLLNGTVKVKPLLQYPIPYNLLQIQKNILLH